MASLPVDEEYAEWQRPAGIFILGPITGPAAAVIHALQLRYDPKLARAFRPHITLAGSSGVGPVRAGTPIDVIERALAPVVASTPPLALVFGSPQRFMQTEIISLPLDPHGPLRRLHDRIVQCGLPFEAARYTFTPHVTLNLYRTLSADAQRALLAVRVHEEAVLDRLVLSMSDEAGRARPVMELELGRARDSGFGTRGSGRK